MTDSYYISSQPYTNAPWKEHRESIKSVKIEYGIKSISNSTFHYHSAGYPNLLIKQGDS